MEIVLLLLIVVMHGESALQIVIRIKDTVLLTGQDDANARQTGGRQMEWHYMKGIPIEAQYLYRKALELSTIKQYETALRYFRQAVVIAPRYSNAYSEMGNCLSGLGKYDEAIASYNKALDLDPLNTDARIKRDLVTDSRTLNNNEHTLNGKVNYLLLQ